MRIKELEELLKTRKKYDNYFTGNILDSNTLQTELGVLQKPIIDAITVTESKKPILQLKDESTQNELIEEIKPEEIKPKIKIDIDDDIEKILKEKTTMPFFPKDLIIFESRLAPTLAPIELQHEIGGKIYLIFHYVISKVNVIFFSDGANLKISINENIYNYSQIFLNIILGDKYKIKNTIETKEFIKTYFEEVLIHKPINNAYYNFLENILGKPQKGRSKSLPKKGKGFGPINLFEKLTLLISAAKSGHDNLENDIKKVCKKLKIMGLISDKIYEKYKNKYFSGPRMGS